MPEKGARSRRRESTTETPQAANMGRTVHGPRPNQLWQTDPVRSACSRTKKPERLLVGAPFGKIKIWAKTNRNWNGDKANKKNSQILRNNDRHNTKNKIDFFQWNQVKIQLIRVGHRPPSLPHLIGTKNDLCHSNPTLGITKWNIDKWQGVTSL
jgi:hypothetical protein